MFSNHHYEKTKEEVVRDVLRAGTDVDCTSFVGQNAASALAKGLITMDDIDARLTMLFKVRMRLSHFDPVGPLQQIPPSAVCTKETAATARAGVSQSSTLLKNRDGALPLSRWDSVAVIGPNANLSSAVASYYGGNTCGGYFNMVDAVASYAKSTTTAAGLPSTTANNASTIAASVLVAGAADWVVLVLGSDLTDAREGSDSTFIAVPDGQVALVNAVLAVTKNPVIIVMLTAIPLDISAWLADPWVGAILHTGQPSVQTFGAADVLYGKVSPAGRTIQVGYLIVL